MKKQFLLLIFVIKHILVSGASFKTTDSIPEPEKIYHLGEVIVSESPDREIVNQKTMQKTNQYELGTSINILASIHLVGSGARNESTVYLRGFDLRNVPVFIDGIPIYVSYDGYVDLARFTTTDLSKIEISKGYSSILYGANTMGGAINMVGYKPEKKIEIQLNTGISSGKGHNFAANIGHNWGKFYLSANISRLQREFLPLSKDFKTGNIETDYKLDNSYRKDDKISLKLGYNPNAANEYSLNYVYQQGEKGNPLYLGSNETIKLRYWQWPHWDKQSIYFLTKTSIGEKNYVKTRLFYDNFINQLKSFDDASYSTQTIRSAFTSNYDDYSYGGSIEAGSYITNNQQIKIAAHFKSDKHRENNEGEAVRTFADYTISLGVENEWKPLEKLKLIPGLSYNLRKSITAEDYNTDTDEISQFPENENDAFNMQLASYYQIMHNISVSYTLAHKTRFATMKDRYSYRLGIAIPNPNLLSESALHQELAAKFDFASLFSIQPSVFYSRLNNTIQMIDNVEQGISQMQNTGKAQFYGADASVYFRPSKKLNISANYTYIKRQNIIAPEIKFTDVPEHKIYALVDFSFMKNLNFVASTEYNSERFSTSDGTINDGFSLLNTQISYSFGQYLKIESGVNNVLDANYSLTEGYPAAGRNYYLSVIFKLNK